MGIRTHDLSRREFQTYALDRAANGTGFLQILGGLKVGTVLIYGVRGQEGLPIMRLHHWRCAVFSSSVHNLDSDWKNFVNGQRVQICGGAVVVCLEMISHR